MARDTGRRDLTLTQVMLVFFAAIFGVFFCALALGLWQGWPLFVSLLLFLTSGLLTSLFRRASGTRGGVRGVASVLSVSPPPDGPMAARCSLRLLVDLPDRPAYVRRLRDPTVYLAKWPQVGMILPVEVPHDNPRALRVLWTIVPDMAQRSLAAREQRARKQAESAQTAEPDRDPEHAKISEPATPPEPSPPPLKRPPRRMPGRGVTHPKIRRRPPVRPYPPVTPSYPPPAAPYPPPLPRRPGAVPTPMPSQRRSGEDYQAADRLHTVVDVLLLVSSLDTSLRFYRDLLGLPVLHLDDASALLSYGDGRILLEQRRGMPPVDRRVVHVYIRVADLPAVYRELREQGAVFAHRPRPIRRTDRQELSVATLHDPDGHAIGLAEWRDRFADPEHADPDGADPGRADPGRGDPGKN